MVDWMDWDPDKESLDDCKDRRVLQCPHTLDGAEVAALKQLVVTTWDGDLVSKSARTSLLKKGLVTQWNGYQVITREGLATLQVMMGNLEWIEKLRRG